jgi:DNA-binding transcriptional MerR regulator
MAKQLTIQETASQTGLSAHTLRYYEKIGLIPPVGRAPSGHRRYSDSDLEWIDLLKRLRDTGMPVAQMIEFTRLTHAGDGTIRQRLAILKAHRETVIQEIQALQDDLSIIDFKIDWYSNWIREDES